MLGSEFFHYVIITQHFCGLQLLRFSIWRRFVEDTITFFEPIASVHCGTALASPFMNLEPPIAQKAHV